MIISGNESSEKLPLCAIHTPRYSYRGVFIWSTKFYTKGGKLLAISREKKAELVETYKSQITDAPAMIFTDYRGISVSEIQDLRAKLGDAGAKYMVIKNSLFSLALEAAERPMPIELLDGPNAVVFLGEDISNGAKALKDWIKDDDVVEVKGGILETSILDVSGVDSLADLPTKEQTQAMLLGALTGPANGLVRVLNAPITDVVNMVNAPGSSLVRVLSARASQLQDG